MRELWLQMLHDIHPDASSSFVSKGNLVYTIFLHHEKMSGVSFSFLFLGGGLSSAIFTDKISDS